MATHAELLEQIWNALYRENNGDTNPDKDWNADTLDAIADLVHHFKPKPSKVFTYEFTLAGWSGSNSNNDHLVKWINAPSIDAIQRLILRTGLILNGGIANGVDIIGPYGIGEGVDAVIDKDGNIIEGELGNTRPNTTAPIDPLRTAAEEALSWITESFRQDEQPETIVRQLRNALRQR